jgi:hypothetical protein
MEISGFVKKILDAQQVSDKFNLLRISVVS